MSKDFLLKEEKFKDLRDRLLNSAAGFYEKLGALLKDDTDLPSRRALLKANYEVAGLANQVGRKEDALALHLRVLAGREALAKLAGGRPGDGGRRGPQPRGRRPRPWKTRANPTRRWRPSSVRARWWRPPTAARRRTRRPGRPSPTPAMRRAGSSGPSAAPSEALRAMEQARDLQAALAAADPKDNDRQTALANSHHNLGILLRTTGKPAEAEAEWQQGAGDPAEAGRRQPRRHRIPQ